MNSYNPDAFSQATWERKLGAAKTNKDAVAQLQAEHAIRHHKIRALLDGSGFTQTQNDDLLTRHSRYSRADLFKQSP